MSKTKDEIQAAALAAIGDRLRSGIDCSMGVGKTRIGLMHAASMYTDYSKFLVVAPKRSIFISWEDETAKCEMEYMNDHIEYVTYISMTKRDYDYDCIYLDECHSLKASHNKWLLGYLKQGGRIVGLTGTYPAKASSEKGKMCNFYCPKVFTYHIDDAIADKLLNDYKIIVHPISLDDTPNIIKKGKHGEWKVSEVEEYAYWTSAYENAKTPKEEQIVSIQRMKALKEFPSKEEYAKKLFNSITDKSILFVNTKKQADALCKTSYHSSNKASKQNLEDLNSGKITKMTAVDMLSEGVSVKNLKTGIIMHAYGSNRKAAQKIGRFLRLNPDEVSTIHILCYHNTVDKKWVTSALKAFDPNKITWKEEVRGV